MPCNYSEYHHKWSLIVRLIRRRSGNRCEGSPRYPDCRAKNGEPHPVTGSQVVLTVAHLDHDNTHNRFWNLRDLCQRCHLNHDINQHVMNRKYGSKWKRDQLHILSNADDR